MVTVQIGDGPVMKQSEISEGWINEQINRRRQDDQAVCVKVTIKSSTVDMLLVTSACPNVRKGRQALTAVQKRIWNLWVACRLNEPAFTGDNLVDFLNQLGPIL